MLFIEYKNYESLPGSAGNRFFFYPFVFLPWFYLNKIGFGFVTVILHIKQEICLINNFLSIFSTSQCWPASSRHCVNIVLTFGTYPVYVDISTCQCWPRSSWHKILIVCLLSCLDCRHRQQCNIDWHWVTMLMSKKCRRSLLDID